LNSTLPALHPPKSLNPNVSGPAQLPGPVVAHPLYVQVPPSVFEMTDELELKPVGHGAAPLKSRPASDQPGGTT
jgi:hypothetical protein